ncbi:MAG: 2-oxoacid:acceptor oxidoreductase subunit alpha [Microscillaceae bacterium]|nr:2-oxoacid:acceptor oxidoreductase subunit alpha [Microscillaceae bacterium]
MKNITKSVQEEVTIKFAGDSGDGMQLTGDLFTNDTALTGSDLATFPDFPAEIRAPAGTLAGVSGFQLHFGSKKIYTPGDTVDVLVAMNAAALKTNLNRVRAGGTLILNEDGFDTKNLRLAKYEAGENPLEDPRLEDYEVFKMNVTKLTRECLKDSPLGTKEKDRCKNMFVLGFLLWRYSRSMDSVIQFIDTKFKGKADIQEANLLTLKAGYHYGDTTETFTTTYEVKSAPLDKGTYRSIMGNQAVVYGLVAASQKSGLPLFYGSYPITPASDILHSLSALKNFGVKTFQAEDEIAAICSAIGASYGGNLAVTGTSGPGLALKGEAMGLALMLELPLLIINIQRGGPSTGLPTKTEQADLLMSLYGRNGESPIPVVAAKSPADAFEAAFEAARIALQHMTPVIFLSDGYIANGAEPWKFPKSSDIPEIKIKFAEGKDRNDGIPYQPYLRDENLVRPWALPGTPGLAHRIGGLEKEDITGNVSYDPANHEHMVKTRAAKVEKIADFIPEQSLEMGVEQGDLLILGWGSTYGVIKSVVNELLNKGHQVAHAQVRYLNPFPKNLGDMMRSYKKVLIPEINNGQLAKVIRDKYLIEVVQYNKIMGIPITHAELRDFAAKLLGEI